MSGIINCARVCFVFYREAYITCIYLFEIDNPHLYFLQMGFAGCLRNRYNSHIICCGSSLLWGFEMFSTAPKRFEYHIILNS